MGLIPSPWDKVVHAFVFAFLAAAIGYASGLNGWAMVLTAFFGALLVGVADEWHQMFLLGRQAGWDDLAADLIGSAVGAFLLRLRQATEQVERLGK
ncbi:MAG: VanZ family protein [Rhizobacter sp.]